MRQRSSSRTSSAAAFCSPRRRSRPAFPIRGCSWRRGLSVARWRSPGRWHTRSWRRCGPAPAVSTSICERRSDVWRRFSLDGRRSSQASPARLRRAAVVLAAYVGRFIPAANDATPLFVVPLAVRAAHVLASGGDGALRDRPDDVDSRPRRRSRTLHHECCSRV